MNLSSSFKCLCSSASVGRLVNCKLCRLLKRPQQISLLEYFRAVGVFGAESTLRFPTVVQAPVTAAATLPETATGILNRQGKARASSPK